MVNEHVKKVEENWSNIWRDHNVLEDNFLYKSYLKIFAPFQSGKFILKEIEKILKSNVKGKKIIECGSGTGLISKEIAKKGAKVTLLDISEEAIKLSKENFKVLNADFFMGSILGIPLKDSTYDVVWNAGVLEHFKPYQQKIALKEMLRILKPGGILITFNPSTKGKYYIKMKEIAEKKGIWKAGYEVPLRSIRDLVDKKYNVTEEYKGYWIQFIYGKYYFKNKFLQYIWSTGFELISPIFKFLDKKPGYFLISVIRKPNN